MFIFSCHFRCAGGYRHSCKPWGFRICLLLEVETTKWSNSPLFTYRHWSSLLLWELPLVTKMPISSPLEQVTCPSSQIYSVKLQKRRLQWETMEADITIMHSSGPLVMQRPSKVLVKDSSPFWAVISVPFLCPKMMWFLFVARVFWQEKTLHNTMQCSCDHFHVF